MQQNSEIGFVMSLGPYPATVLPALGAANPGPAGAAPRAPPPRGAGGVNDIWLANF